jgi:hypothetical protein
VWWLRARKSGRTDRDKEKGGTMDYNCCNVSVSSDTGVQSSVETDEKAQTKALASA